MVLTGVFSLLPICRVALVAGLFALEHDALAQRGGGQLLFSPVALLDRSGRGSLI